MTKETAADVPELSIWNRYVLDLAYALLGAVSPNFRMVALGWANHRWILIFHLNEENAEDRGAIEDVVCDFYALQAGPMDADTIVHVSAGPFLVPGEPSRMVFRRRESTNDFLQLPF